MSDTAQVLLQPIRNAMKIYRSGKSQQLYLDDAHLVDTLDLSEQAESLEGNGTIRISLSKDSLERQSVGIIEIEDTDIPPLLLALTSRLLKKVQMNDEAHQRAAILNNALTTIRIKAFDKNTSLNDISAIASEVQSMPTL